MLALQEQRSQLEQKQQEKKQSEDNKKKEEAEKREAAEKVRAAELAKSTEEKKLAAEAKKAEEEERKKMEAYKKTPPVIEVTQSDPDEFGAVILDITVSKPTKSLSINGEAEGASKDGKYRVKRILKKAGATNFSFSATDEYGNKGSYTLVAKASKTNSSAKDVPVSSAEKEVQDQNLKKTKIVESDFIKENKKRFECSTLQISIFFSAYRALKLNHPEFSPSDLWFDGKYFNHDVTCGLLGGDGEKVIMFVFFPGRKYKSQEELNEQFENNSLAISHSAKTNGKFIDMSKSMCFSALYRNKKNEILKSGYLFMDGKMPYFLDPVERCPAGYPIID